MARRQMTMRDLSEVTGISTPLISRMTRAERSIDVDQLRLICNALDLPMLDLLREAIE